MTASLADFLWAVQRSLAKHLAAPDCPAPGTPERDKLDAAYAAICEARQTIDDLPLAPVDTADVPNGPQGYVAGAMWMESAKEIGPEGLELLSGAIEHAK